MIKVNLKAEGKKKGKRLAGKIGIIIIGTFFPLIIGLPSVAATPLNSQNYQIDSDVFSGGGSSSTSASYINQSSIAQVWVAGVPSISASGIQALHSFWPTVIGEYTLDTVINLNSGWNLISLSLEPADTAIATVLDSISGKYVSAWAFMNGGWKVYDPQNPGFSDLTTMEAGWGYWVNMTEAATLSVSGSAPSNSISLSSGWNLVGCNTSTSPTVGNALTSINGKYVSVWVYINGAWKVYDPANPGFSDLITMEPNYGYWIKTTEACTWTMP